MRSRNGAYLGKHPATRSILQHAMRRWYVIANRVEAVIYQEDWAHDFAFLDRLSNPDGDLMESEFVSDRSGRSQSSAGSQTIRHALDKKAIHHERNAQIFARKIAKTLDQADKGNLYNELVLVSEPHFLGLLRSELSSSVKKQVKHEINREFAKGSDETLKLNLSRVLAEKKRAKKIPA